MQAPILPGGCVRREWGIVRLSAVAGNKSDSAGSYVSCGQEDHMNTEKKQSDYEEVRGTGTESGAEEGKKRCVEDRINVSEMKMVYSGKKFRNESADFFRWTGEEISLIPP